MAAARALTNQQLGKYMSASIEQAAHFRVQVENWKDSDELTSAGQKSGSLCRRTTQVGSNDQGGKCKCMRCRKRSMRKFLERAGL